jgi:putative transposase
VAAVIDLFSRRVGGGSMKAEMTAQLVTDARLMAIRRHGKPEVLPHHSDQGSQGRFNRSSQHQEIGGWDDGWSTSIGSKHTAEVAFAGKAACLAA